VDVLSGDQVQRQTPGPGSPVTDRLTLGMVGRYVTLVGLPTGVTYPRQITGVDVSTQRAYLDPALTAADVGGSCTLQVVEWADLGLTVTQPAAAAGGRLGWLDAIGRDRNAGRVLGEPDAAYRERVCQLADTISPAALRRTIDRVLSNCGIAWDFQETRDVAKLKGFVWDLDPLDFGQVAPIPRDPAGDLYGEGAVLLNQSMAWTFFLVRVGLGNAGEFGFPFDAINPTFPNAWDWAFFDGTPVGYNSCIGQLWESLNGARLAGVNFLILRDPGLT